MEVLLQITAIILSVALVVIILLQVKGSGLGSLLGGEGMSSITRTRRGLEKTLFQATIVFAFIFVVISILAVAYSS